MKKNEKLWREISFYLSPRYILGMALILTAFLSAYVVNRSADRTTIVWSATTDLAPGSEITASDIAPVRVRFLSGAARYLDANTPIIGTSAVRTIGSGELIPAKALTESGDLSLLRVPISVTRDHAPVGLSSGSQVDIYSVPNSSQSLSGVNDRERPKLLLRDVAIEAIDDRANDLGGALILTVLIPENLVQILVATFTDQSLVLVRRVGSR